MVDFVVYEHKLLIWWENISIEYILNRSNEHLRKFASTSLIPAKMTTNNFEIWLKDINLPDLFHISFQIQTKPVPILNIKKDNSDKNQDEFAKDKMLEAYYDSLSLDYKRRNDLQMFSNTNEELKTIIDSAELNISNVSEKNWWLSKILEKWAQKYDFIWESVSKKIQYDTMDNFWDQFLELELFSKAIFDYVNNLESIIKQMKEIPIW